VKRFKAPYTASTCLVSGYLKKRSFGGVLPFHLLFHFLGMEIANARNMPVLMEFLLFTGG
jgi:hypothetical protein